MIVPGIYSSLELTYLNYSGMPCISHISISPITPSDFDFIGATKMNYPEVNTCVGLFPNSDGTFMFKGSV